MISLIRISIWTSRTPANVKRNPGFRDTQIAKVTSQGAQSHGWNWASGGNKYHILILLLFNYAGARIMAGSRVLLEDG